MTTTAPPAPRAGNFAPFLIVVAVAIGVFIMLAAGRDPWNDLFINPLLNALILLNILVLGNFGLSIILFTILLRLVTLPFTIRQFQSMKAMQSAQPRIQEVQKKYKDPRRRQEEMVKLYREYNINPLGCFLPLAIQLGVFIALSSALRHLVGGTPESMIGLSQRVYPFGFLQATIPLNQHFLWMNLGTADTTFALPVLVAISTYVQQKMSQQPNSNPQMQQQQQMMTWLMPMMLLFLTLNLPSGVGVYWLITNIFSLFASYYVYGRRALSWRMLLPNAGFEAPAGTATDGRAKVAATKEIEAPEEEDEEPEPEPEERVSSGTDPASRTRRRRRRRR